MLTDANFEDLKTKGYTVVPNVLTLEECDQTIGQYRDWLSQLKEGEWIINNNSLVQRYNSGHMEPSWFVRLKSKNVFAQIWKTDKLLSSIDVIAIGRPPEEGEEQFHKPGDHWLHFDQTELREGLHAYQGVVYLEAADEDDWTFHVMEGSHLKFKEFYENNERAKNRTDTREYFPLLDDEVVQMKESGCPIKRVAVPKGGMALWDSRLVHANAKPVQGRNNAGRWRFCVLVSMTPAIWASKEDMRKKKEAYDTVSMTTHWSSQGVKLLKLKTDTLSLTQQNIDWPKELPEIAKTKEAKLLSGVLPYDFNDGKPNGDEYFPKWAPGIQGEYAGPRK